MSEKHTQLEENGESPFRLISYLILIVFPIFLFFTGSWNLYLSSELGNRDGSNLWSLFQQWRAGIHINGSYSEVYLMAMRRLTTAIYQLSGGFITLIAAFIVIRAWNVQKKKEISP